MASAAITESWMLFQIAGMTPDAVVTVRHVSSVNVLGSTLPLQNFPSETMTSAAIGSTVAKKP